MLEFIIRRTDGDDPDFDLDYTLYSSVLHPNSVPYKVVESWGGHRIEALGCKIAFSEEFVGFQVSFESGNISREIAQKILEEILHNIEQVTGQCGEVIQISFK